MIGTLRFEKHCKVLSSNITEVSVTFITLGNCTGSNFKTASALSGLFGRCSPQRQGKTKDANDIYATMSQHYSHCVFSLV